MAGNIDHVKPAFPATAFLIPFALLEKGQNPAIGRPGRAFHQESPRQLAFTAAVGMHDADEEFPTLHLGKGDVIAARRPDLTIILDLDPQIGLQRAQNRAALDRFEREKLEFFEKVRQAYLDIASAEQERCIVVDASQDLEAVSSELLIKLEEKLSLLQKDD